MDKAIWLDKSGGERYMNKKHLIIQSTLGMHSMDKLDIKLEIDKRAEFIVDTLIDNGFSAYVVGGSVRDMLMNRELGTNRLVNDWDIATSAKPQEVINTFRNLGLTVLKTGLKHGTVTVLLNKKKYDILKSNKTVDVNELRNIKDDSDGYEITTYRFDGEYSDGRHPDKVVFTKNIEDDLLRRDLTINALAYAQGTVVGVPGAFKDLQYGIIRAVGNPEDRLTEDPLRIVRAFRFQASLGFKLDAETKKVMNLRVDSIDSLAKERIHAELVKAFSGEHIAEAVRDNEEIIWKIFPDLKKQYKFNQQNPNHDRDLWEHTLATLESTAKDSYGDYILNIAALLHDIGKVDTQSDSLGSKVDGFKHYPNHGKVGAEKVRSIVRELKFSNQEIKSITELVEIHDRQIETKKSLKVLISKLGIEQIRRLIILKQSDMNAQSSFKKQSKVGSLMQVMLWLSEIERDNEACSLSDLKITGQDLIDMGIKPGKRIGEVLKHCLDKVLSEEVSNDRVSLILYIEKKFNIG